MQPSDSSETHMVLLWVCWVLQQLHVSHCMVCHGKWDLITVVRWRSESILWVFLQVSRLEYPCLDLGTPILLVSLLAHSQQLYTLLSGRSWQGQIQEKYTKITKFEGGCLNPINPHGSAPAWAFSDDWLTLYPVNWHYCMVVTKGWHVCPCVFMH